jgi:ribosomal protein L28
MARSCAITGKTTQVGGRYSNRTRATQFNPTGKVRRKANLQKRRIFVPELNKIVMVDISVAGLRTIIGRGGVRPPPLFRIHLPLTHLRGIIEETANTTL